MKRRAFLQASFAGGAGLLAKPVPAQTRPPNIVLMMADDLGYECLGCNGALDYRTPRLDAMAAAGVRFTGAHSTPLCTPTRVQLMTGKYNFRNYTEFGALPPGEFTFGHLLQQAGYRTCVVGKWQLAGKVEGTAQRGEGTLPQDAGFDEHCLWQVKNRGSRYWRPIVQINGELQSEMNGRYGPDIFLICGEIRGPASRPSFLSLLSDDPHARSFRSYPAQQRFLQGAGAAKRSWMVRRYGRLHG
jgi:arylsulfatase A-like enzyme